VISNSYATPSDESRVTSMNHGDLSA